MNENWSALAAQYRGALLDDAIPFWLRHSPDRECGGYFTCLARDGAVYDTDKFMWLQGRQVWTLSMLCNRLERRSEWLEPAASGVRFLRAHGRDADGNWYFALDRAGGPLVQPYNIFSDCFAAMGFSQYALAAGDDGARAIAADTFRNILRRAPSPKGRYSKAGAAARPMQSLVLPMILCNLALELEWLLEPAEVESVLDDSLRRVMELCLDRRRMMFFENVNPDGTHPDCFDGRLLSPGHGIEAAWFVMAAAKRRGDRAAIADAVEASLRTLAYGWDEAHGGIVYFRDAKGFPPDRLDWDQKLWWVHLETLVALLMGHRLTGRRECAEWFRRVHDWTWAHFPDPAHGEWYGYLDRRGEPLLTCKGGKWKGCFHVPRGLYMCWRELERLETPSGRTGEAKA